MESEENSQCSIECGLMDQLTKEQMRNIIGVSSYVGENVDGSYDNNEDANAFFTSLQLQSSALAAKSCAVEDNKCEKKLSDKSAKWPAKRGRPRKKKRGRPSRKGLPRITKTSARLRWIDSYDLGFDDKPKKSKDVADDRGSKVKCIDINEELLHGNKLVSVSPILFKDDEELLLNTVADDYYYNVDDMVEYSHVTTPRGGKQHAWEVLLNNDHHAADWYSVSDNRISDKKKHDAKKDSPDIHPPSCHTSGKWLPPPPTIGGKWVPNSDKKKQEAKKESKETSHPPNSHTSGKWLPSPPTTGGKWVLNIDKKVDVRTKKNSDDSIHPPSSHTSGKWLPPPPTTGGKWMPSSEKKLDARTKKDLYEVDNIHPPSSHTSGKWLPSPSTSSGKWLPNSDSSCIDKKKLDVRIKRDLVKVDNNHPPSGHTSGKWVPSSGKQKEEAFARKESKKTSQPPNGHISGKWVPPPPTTSGKWVPSSSTQSAPPVGYCKGKWVPNSTTGTLGKCLKTSGGSVSYHCSPCNRLLSSRAMYTNHIKSELHIKRCNIVNCAKENDVHTRSVRETTRAVTRSSSSAFQGVLVFCPVCETDVYTRQLWKHLDWVKHREKFDNGNKVHVNFILENMRYMIPKSSYYCRVCKCYLNNNNDLIAHWSSDHHKKHELSCPDMTFLCVFCNHYCSESNSMLLHIQSEDHLNKLLSNSCRQVVVKQVTLFTCKECNLQFQHSFQKLRHDFSKHRLRQKKLNCREICGDCNRKFDGRDELEKHECSGSLSLKKSDLTCSRKCMHCGEVLKTVELLKEHVFSQHSKLLPSCVDCGEKFALPQLLSVHRRMLNCRIQDDSSLLRCSQCKYETKYRYMLLYHRMIAHENIGRDGSWTCPVCKKNFTGSRFNLRYHLRKHTDEEAFQCRECSLSFKLRFHLSKHIVTAHSDIVMCSECSFQSSDRRQMEEHQKKHRKSAVYDHLESQKDKQERRMIGDEEDHTQEEAQNAAEQESHPQKEQKCEACQFKETKNKTLQQHCKEQHTVWTCSNCSYSTSIKSSWTRHLKVHSDVKTYQCNYCSFTTKESSNLTRHLRIHTGSKPFKCPYCPHTCNALENLRKHVLSTKSHAGKSLYVCRFCNDYSSNSAFEFKTHLVVNHPDDTPSLKLAASSVRSVYVNDEDQISDAPLQRPHKPARIETITKPVPVLTSPKETVSILPKPVVVLSRCNAEKITKLEKKKAKSETVIYNEPKLVNEGQKHKLEFMNGIHNESGLNDETVTMQALVIEALDEQTLVHQNASPMTVEEVDEFSLLGDEMTFDNERGLNIGDNVPLLVTDLATVSYEINEPSLQVAKEETCEPNVVANERTSSVSEVTSIVNVVNEVMNEPNVESLLKRPSSGVSSEPVTSEGISPAKKRRDCNVDEDTFNYIGRLCETVVKKIFSAAETASKDGKVLPPVTVQFVVNYDPKTNSFTSSTSVDSKPIKSEIIEVINLEDDHDEPEVDHDSDSGIGNVRNSCEVEPANEQQISVPSQNSFPAVDDNIEPDQKPQQILPSSNRFFPISTDLLQMPFNYQLLDHVIPTNSLTTFEITPNGAVKLEKDVKFM